jgi:hypothetical protein
MALWESSLGRAVLNIALHWIMQASSKPRDNLALGWCRVALYSRQLNMMGENEESTVCYRDSKAASQASCMSFRSAWMGGYV